MKNGLKIRIPIDDPTGIWLALQDKDGDNVSILHTSTMEDGMKTMLKQQKLWKKSGTNTEIVQIIPKMPEPDPSYYNIIAP